MSRQGRHPGGAAPADRQGRCRQDRRVRRRGREDPVRARAGHHHQHGRRAGRHHLDLPRPTRSPKTFLEAQGRGERTGYRPVAPTSDAEYDEESSPSTCPRCEPLAAMPHMPRTTSRTVSEIGEIKVDQVLHRLLHQLLLLRHDEGCLHPQGQDRKPGGFSLTISARLQAGVQHAGAERRAGQISSPQAPGSWSAPAAPASAWVSRPESGGVSLRTFNRNFEGRSGTPGCTGLPGQPREVAAASALTGCTHRSAHPRRDAADRNA